MAVIPSIEEEKISNNNDNDKLSEEISQLGKLKTSVMKLEKDYSKMFPKVSPKLIKDLIIRQMQFPNKLPVFTLEVFTKKVAEGGIDSNTLREHIWNTTGKMPGIYDNGTHYVTNQRLTLETLKKLNDFPHVLEVTGEYSGDSYASLGPTHERSLVPKVQHPEKVLLKVEQKGKEKASVLKIVICTIIGITGAVALGGFIISGGILPNAHTNDAIFTSSLSQEPGKLHGFVSGVLPGLPAIGASVIAANQGTGHTVNSVISIDGKYYLDLAPGMYNILITFPDGTSQAYNDVVIKRGTASEMDFKY
jgi:hypothetical protein